MGLEEKYKNFIYKLNKGSGYNCGEAARMFEKKYGFSVSQSTIIKWWKNKNLKIMARGGRRESLEEGKGALTKQDHYQMLLHYLKYRGRASYASRNEEKGYAINSYLNFWKSVGLEKYHSLKNPESLKPLFAPGSGLVKRVEKLMKKYE